jgi:TonB family protein
LNQNMKTVNVCVLFIFSLLSFVIRSQTNDDFMLKDNLDRFPDNVGGKVEFQHFFEAHIQYPDKALKEKKEGIVKIKFIVMSDGKAIKPEVIGSAGAELDQEAMRLFKLLEWIPAEKEGQKVNTWHSVSFPFDIEKFKKYAKARGFIKPKFDKKTVVDSGVTIIDRPDIMADYYKGETALTEYIQSTIEYPNTAKLQNIQGVVQLSFVVEVDGKLSNIAIEKGVAGGCNEEAINLMWDTKWKPAVHKGKLVRSRYQYAIQFSLNNTYKANEMGEQK